MKVVAVIPAFNEELSIGSVVLLTKKYVDDVIVVDDGSTDRTGDIAELAGAKVIRHHKNKGKGASLKTGFEYAKNKNADIIVTLDGDFQHNPDEIPKLITPIIEGKADFVNGSRYLRGDPGTPKYRRIGQKVLDVTTNITAGIKISDTQSGFRAFSKKCMPYFRFKDDGFGIESEMLVDAAKAGLKIVEVEIGSRYDVGKPSENPISHGLKVLAKILHDMEFERPLYYFTLPGLVVMVIGMILGLIFLRDYLIGRSVNIGPTIVAGIMALFGTFFIFTGIILDSINRMMKERWRGS